MNLYLFLNSIIEQERKGPGHHEKWQLPLKGRYPVLKPGDKKLVDVPDYLVRIQLEIVSERTVADRLTPQRPMAPSAIELATFQLTRSVHTGEINEGGLRNSGAKGVDKATARDLLRAKSNIGILTELFSLLNKNYCEHGFTHDLASGCTIDIRFDEENGRLVYIEKPAVRIRVMTGVMGSDILEEDFAGTGLTRPLPPEKPTVTVAESTLAEGERPVLQSVARKPFGQIPTRDDEDSDRGVLNDGDLRLTPLFGPNSSWQPDPHNPKID